MRVAVLGAGVAGCSISRMLHDNGYDVTLYEKDPSIGGLAKTKVIDGYIFDLHGGHLFGTKNKRVEEWAFSILPKENWEHYYRNAKIFMQGKFITYPFESGLCQLDDNFAIDCALDYIQAQQGSMPDNYYDWLEWQFGKTIADFYMRPYNRKIWGYPLEDMEIEWVHGKMPLSSKREILESLVKRDSKERNSVHSSFHYPKLGIQMLYDTMAKPLTVLLNTPVERIEKSGDKWIINGTETYDSVVSTLPIVEMPNMMTLPQSVVSAIGQLVYNSHTSVFFNSIPSDIHWLYLPENNYRAHRVGYMTSMCSVASPDSGAGNGAIELIGEKFDVPNDFILREGIVPNELGLKRQFGSAFAKYAYVVHSKGYERNTKMFRDYFADVDNFHLLGRWAYWHYANMDICMGDAMKIVDKYFPKVGRQV
ncbi:MAG: FAD-dependent oxidoreductase [Clostridiales bacterium]|jgi:protoporphyrinogen oxidase|nr:FAD-dependent oxidoreductase [Clostridiales bacterium]